LSVGDGCLSGDEIGLEGVNSFAGS
jgi:hypothetical protein